MREDEVRTEPVEPTAAETAEEIEEKLVAAHDHFKEGRMLLEEVDELMADAHGPDTPDKTTLLLERAIKGANQAEDSAWDLIR